MVLPLMKARTMRQIPTVTESTDLCSDALSLYPNDRKAYVVVLNIDNESLSRIYQLSSDTLFQLGMDEIIQREKQSH